MDHNSNGFMVLGLNIPNKCFHFLRCGPLIDLCRGPHVRHTGKIKTIKIHKVSAGTAFTQIFSLQHFIHIAVFGLSQECTVKGWPGQKLCVTDCERLYARIIFTWCEGQLVSRACTSSTGVWICIKVFLRLNCVNWSSLFLLSWWL